MIDPHVHLRDWEERDKETISHAFRVAGTLGFTDLFDMPNTRPPLTSRENIEKRLRYAEPYEKESGVSYHLYGGLTRDEREIEEMVRAVDDLFPKVVGLKVFLSQSTGNMGISDYSSQRMVFEKLHDLGYSGVVVVHAEKEALFHPELYVKGEWDTHSLSRPRESEIESVRDIIRIVEETDFKGHLHVAHVSTKDSVKLISEAKKRGDRISFGVTPHHALFASSDAKEHSKYLKMNPPLRDEEDREYIFRSLLDGTADNIESDHAPHTLLDKENGASGIPSLPLMGILIDRLLKSGISKERLMDLTGGNISRIFSVPYKEVPIREDIESLSISLMKEYPFSPL